MTPPAVPVAPTLASAVELLEAVERGELVLHYQAIFGLPELEVVGFEALLRWEHPSRGLLRPGAFLPADLDGGLGWALTNFALEEALRACAAWQADGLAAGVSVNVSPGWFGDPFLRTHLQDLLDRHGLGAQSVTIELTEHPATVPPEVLQRAAGGLAGAGVRVSLDDFGTGGSTLARLRDLPAHEIKIDRGFVSRAPGHPVDETIVRFAAALADGLGVVSVAEGVEDEAMLEVALAAGVGFAQGFHLHEPEAFVAGRGFERLPRPVRARDGTIWL